MKVKSYFDGLTAFSFSKKNCSEPTKSAGCILAFLTNKANISKYVIYMFSFKKISRK